MIFPVKDDEAVFEQLSTIVRYNQHFEIGVVTPSFRRACLIADRIGKIFPKCSCKREADRMTMTVNENKVLFLPINSGRICGQRLNYLVLSLENMPEEFLQVAFLTCSTPRERTSGEPK